MARPGTFPKGKSGNPDGRPPLSPDAKALKKLTQESLEEIGDLILRADKPALSIIAASTTEPAIRVIYAKAALNAMVKGDVQNLEVILNRCIGKVKERTEHSFDKDTLEALVAGGNKE